MWSIPRNVVHVCHLYLERRRKLAALVKEKAERMALLKKLSKNIIINDVIRSTCSERKAGEVYWKVLILDHYSSKIVSHSCGMQDITAEGMTLVEDLHKGREPLPFLEAVYILKPTDPLSVERLLADLNSSPPIYKAFHVFLVEMCPPDVFDKFATVTNASRVKTFKEINIAFIPYESHVFLLENNPACNKLYFNPSNVEEKEAMANMERMSGQIATLCASLGECPSIRYRSGLPINDRLADLVHKKLQEYKNIDPSMGEGPEKTMSQLIILDRGFDCVTPVVHELTFEAMIHDLLPLENGAYMFKTNSGECKKIYLDDDSDESWNKLKHLHIANVSKQIFEKIQEFKKTKRIDTKAGDQAMSMRDLQIMVKKLPQYQKEMTVFASQWSMAEDCLKAYERVKKLCNVEQDLATGIDAQGERIKDFMGNINPILLDVDEKSVTNEDKLRIIILYILAKNGVSEESFSKLFVHAILDSDMKQRVSNLSFLGNNPISSTGMGKKDNFERKKREEVGNYVTSRWIPVLKDIIEFAMEDKLERKQFPYKFNRSNDSPGTKSALSTRQFGKWHPRNEGQLRNVPRLILFIVGGATLSETRTVYEINQAQSEWEVVIGSTEVITPTTFLNNLATLQ